jgi:hypothetical protein
MARNPPAALLHYMIYGSCGTYYSGAGSAPVTLSEWHIAAARLSCAVQRSQSLCLPWAQPAFQIEAVLRSLFKAILLSAGWTGVEVFAILVAIPDLLPSEWKRSSVELIGLAWMDLQTTIQGNTLAARILFAWA